MPIFVFIESNGVIPMDDETAGIGPLLYRWFPGFSAPDAWSSAGLTVPAGLVGAYCAGNAGLTRELALGALANWPRGAFGCG